MQVVVSVKKPIRWAPGLMIESSPMVVELRRMVLVGGDAGRGVTDPRELARAAAVAAGADVDHERLSLVDRRVGVAREHDQIVGRVARDRPAGSPVPGQGDMVARRSV